MAGKAKLSPKQRAFIENYLRLWNATEAAKQAGYSEKTAQEQGSRLLSNVMVAAAVERRIAQLKAGADEVLLRLASHSRSNMADFINDYGTIDIDRARDAGKLRLVKKIAQHTTRVSKKNGDDVEYHRIELELYDAQAATVQLAKILGQYPAIKVTEVPWEEEAKRLGVLDEAQQMRDNLFEKVAQKAVVLDDTGNHPD